MDWDSVLKGIDQLGTLGVIVVGLWAAYTGRVKFKKDFDEQRAQYEALLEEQAQDFARELAYVEARRAEEREGRIAAEKRVSAFTTSFNEVLTVMRGIKEEVIRGGGTRP